MHHQSRRIAVAHAPKYLSGTIVAIGMILASLGGAPALASAQSATVRMTPATQTIVVGSVATQEVVIENVANLYGAEIHLAFDPRTLTVLDADPNQPGTQVALGQLLTSGTYFVAVNRVDNAQGKIDLALTELNPTPPVTGSGTLARISFGTLALGTTPVAITSVMMSDRNGNVIAQNTNGTGNIAVVQGGITLVALDQPISTIRATPNTQTIRVGANAAQEVVVENVANLYGAEIHLAFDPTVLTVLDSDPNELGTQIALGPLLTSATYYVAVNRADNAQGKIDLALTQLNPTLPVTGTGTLAQINFKTRAVGTTTVVITSVIMSDRNGTIIAQNTNGTGNIAVVQGGITSLAPSGVQFQVFIPIVIR